MDRALEAGFFRTDGKFELGHGRVFRGHSGHTVLLIAGFFSDRRPVDGKIAFGQGRYAVIDQQFYGCGYSTV